MEMAGWGGRQESGSHLAERDRPELVHGVEDPKSHRQLEKDGIKIQVVIYS